jgi:hypothetical protein
LARGIFSQAVGFTADAIVKDTVVQVCYTAMIITSSSSHAMQPILEVSFGRDVLGHSPVILFTSAQLEGNVLCAELPGVGCSLWGISLAGMTCPKGGNKSQQCLLYRKAGAGNIRPNYTKNGTWMRLTCFSCGSYTNCIQCPKSLVYVNGKVLDGQFWRDYYWQDTVPFSWHCTPEGVSLDYVGNDTQTLKARCPIKEYEAAKKGVLLRQGYVAVDGGNRGASGGTQKKGSSAIAAMQLAGKSTHCSWAHKHGRLSSQSEFFAPY